MSGISTTRGFASPTSNSSSETDERSSERGYIMAMTALLLIPLMIFAAFAVDVGAWYAQAARTQRAADAAALAAVVWMPNEATATTAALDVAAKNGYVHGVNATVTVERQGAQQVKVHIVSEGSVYFGAVVMDSIDIERFAVAEYILPVPMGNPTNVLGGGNIPGIGDGIWLSINGICWPREHGDLFSVRSAENLSGVVPTPKGRFNTCLGTGYSGPVSPTYDSEGYTYVIDVPEGSGDVNVQIFEPGNCPDTGAGDSHDLGWAGTQDWARPPSDHPGPKLNARLYAADDTPLSDQDNLDAPPVANVTFGRNDCNAGIGGDPHWYNVATIPAGNPGRWFLRVRGVSHELSGDIDDRVAGLNNYALRLARGSDNSQCSRLSTPTCPQIFAKDWLSLHRPVFPGGELVANFYLAEISEVHAGKTVEIIMFDLGEGMHDVQIQSPGGISMPFEYQIYDCELFDTCTTPALQTHDPACGGTPCLDVRADKFNDHAVRVLVDLPAGYDCDGESHCWWKVRYDANGGDREPTDRTTWSVRVIGDPVRLTE